MDEQCADEKLEIEAFLTGDGSWRLDISDALDGDERSSMTRLYKLIAEHFDALSSWPKRPSFSVGAKVQQCGAVRIKVERIEHPRNEL